MEDFGDDDGFDWDNVFSEDLTSNESGEPQKKKRRTLEPRLFPGPAGILPKIAIDTKVRHILFLLD